MRELFIKKDWLTKPFFIKPENNRIPINPAIHFIAGIGITFFCLKIRINVRFTNKKTEKDDFEKAFEFYYDYPATSQLNGALLSKALDEIFERITQDIFNESLAKW